MNYGKKGTAKKQKAISSKSSKTAKKLSVRFFKSFLLFLVLAAVVIGCAGIGVLKGVIDNAPDVSSINLVPQGYSSFVYDTDGNEIAKLVASKSNRIYVTIDDIPEDLQHAFVSIEDERFYDHNGIDIQGIIRAGFVGITSGNFSEGASTITQQLIKNNVFSDWVDESSFTDKLSRKIQEQYLAVQVENDMNKEIILEYYLNTINLGQNTLGVQVAAKRYFNKDVSEITLSEAAVLAAITQNPSKYNPINNPDDNAARRQKVLDNMLEQEYITQEQYDDAVADNVYSRIQDINAETESSSIYTYFVDELIEQVATVLQEEKGYTSTQAYNLINSGGLSIYSTQDSSIQQICDEEFADDSNYPAGTEVGLSYELSVTKADGSVENYSHYSLESYFTSLDKSFDLVFDSEEEGQEYIEQYKEYLLESGDEVLAENITFTRQPQASVVVMDQSSGEVKAIVGGRGDKTGSLTLNRATNTTRQPGSTFKVISTYAPALDSGDFTLASVQDDAEYAYENGRPVSNWYSSGYKGLQSVRYGIEQSLNIVAVKTLTDITPQLGYDYCINFGFTTLVDKWTDANGEVHSDIVQSLALGGITNGVTNLELTAAYATVANGGTYTEPMFFTKILDNEGNVLIDNTPETRTVIKDSTAWLLTDAMKDVVNQGTGTRTRLTNMTSAGKTGTTSDNKDIWFSGYTPYYTCTVWGGYDNNLQISKGNTSYAQGLWKNIMERIHEDLENKDFTKPSSIVTASVCKKSGKLAVEGVCDHDPRGSMVTTEYFAEGTVPTDYCDTHVLVATCMVSGDLAGELCPEQDIENRVYIVRPEGSTGTTDDSPYVVPADISEGTCFIHNNPYFGGSSTHIPNGIIPTPGDDDDDNGTPTVPTTPDTDGGTPDPGGGGADATPSAPE